MLDVLLFQLNYCITEVCYCSYYHGLISEIYNELLRKPRYKKNAAGENTFKLYKEKPFHYFVLVSDPSPLKGALWRFRRVVALRSNVGPCFVCSVQNHHPKDAKYTHARRYCDATRTQIPAAVFTVLLIVSGGGRGEEGCLWANMDVNDAGFCFVRNMFHSSLLSGGAVNLNTTFKGCWITWQFF